MKQIIGKSFAFVVFLFVAFGCSTIEKVQKEVEKTQSPQVLTSTDGTCQITVPGSWSSETDLNPEAVLQASNRLQEEYIVIIRESKADFGKKANLDFVTGVIHDQLQKSLSSDAVLSEATTSSVGNYSARQFEASGEVQNIKVKYLYTVVETPESYYQLITWSLVSKFDANRPQLLEVVNSFKEVSDSPNAASSSIPKPSGK